MAQDFLCNMQEYQRLSFDMFEMFLLVCDKQNWYRIIFFYIQYSFYSYKHLFANTPYISYAGYALNWTTNLYTHVQKWWEFFFQT